MNGKRFVLCKQVNGRAIIVFVKYTKWTLIQMVDFIIYFSAMEHQYERAVSKLRFYKNFKRIRLCLKLIKVDGLARTDSLSPAFLHKEDTCSLKFKFQSISIPNNFCLILSNFFCSSILAPTFYFLYSEMTKWQFKLRWQLDSDRKNKLFK